MLRSLSQRRLEGELMDDPRVNGERHIQALRGLRRINSVSRTAATLWPHIEAIARAHPGRPLSLLDVATGGGDVAIELARRARRAGVTLAIEACDISPTALRFAAQEAERENLPIGFFGLDVVNETLPKHYDVITCSLFLHHLTQSQIVGLLETLTEHSDRLIVSDLVRSRCGYALAYLGTRLLTTSKIVHVDGLRSVRAALTLSEARALASEAGLDDAHFERCWPSRFLLSWCRPASPPTTDAKHERRACGGVEEGV